MSPEMQPTGMGAEEIAYLEAQRKILRDMISAANAQAVAEKFNALGAAGSQVRSEVRERTEAVKKGDAAKANKPLEGKVGDEAGTKHKAAVIEVYVKEIIKAYKENPSLIPVSEGNVSGKVLRNILRNISNPEAEINTYGASYLYKVINHALTNKISDPLTALSDKELQQLQVANPDLHSQLVDALASTARDIGKSEDEIEKFKEKAEIPQRERRPAKTPEEAFEQDWGYSLSRFFDEKDREIIKSLYSMKDFSDYALKTRKSFTDKGFSADEADLLASERMEGEIVSRFSKLFLRIDTENPTEFFEGLIQSGFNLSIETSFNSLRGRLQNLAEQIERGECPEELKKMKTFKRSLKGGDVLKEISADKVKKIAVEHRVVPIPVVRQTDMGDFLNGLVMRVKQEMDTRRYLHNVRALYLKPAGKDGFWPQMAGYAEQLTSVDIDEMKDLTDGDMIMTAQRLYTKYLEEDFAKYDWIHVADEFSPTTGRVTSKLEEKVMQDLRQLFKDKVALENGGEDTWRLRRAINMAIGISRGVLLTEVEMAAWADPQLNPDGSATFKSYYTNDNSALAPFNPMHHFYRWQAEATLSPILFLPVEGIESKFFKSWNHKELWDRMRKYREAYLKGDSVFFDRRNSREKMLVDILPGWSKSGSILSRGGWRDLPAYEGWLEYNKADGMLKDLDYFKSWKAIENIGFEMLQDFAGRIIKSDFLTPKDAAGAARRDEFINYLYKKFINRRGDASGLNSEIKKFEEMATKEIDDKIKRKLIAKGDRKKEIEKATYAKIIYRSLAGSLMQRIPTKMVRIERNRLTKNGVRAWEVLRSQLGWSAEEFDETMQSIMLTEASVRHEITEKMKEHLKNKPDDGKTLWDYETDDYVVNETALERTIKDSMKLEKAKKLLSAIRRECLTNEKLDELAAKIEAGRDGFPFALAPEEVETYFLSYRKTGQRVLPRALGDIGQVEVNMYGPLKDLLNTLQSVAIDPNHDISKIIESLTKIKGVMTDLHGKNESQRTIYRLAMMTIAYFKKDTVTRIPGGGLLTAGQKHSVAAEFAGSRRVVWEWDVSDIDKFMVELESRQLLSKEPYDLASLKGSPNPAKSIYIPGVGEINLGQGESRDPIDLEYFSGTLRKAFGATGKNITYEIIRKYLPIAAAIMLWQFISKAFKGDDEKK